MTTKFYQLDKIEKLYLLSHFGFNRMNSVTLISTQKKIPARKEKKKKGQEIVP